MLSIVSIGISHYVHDTYSDIPCAKQDAQRVYDAFRAALGRSFQYHSSICLENITSQTARTLLEQMSQSRQDEHNYDDVLVIYFSGHAALDKDEISLCFTQCDSSLTGSLSIREIVQIFRRNTKLLLILDCCYAGMALKSVETDINGLRAAILASCGCYDRAVFNAEEGSVFTKVLCAAIQEIQSENAELSVSSIAKLIFELGYRDACVHLGSAEVGDTAFMLASNQKSLSFYSDFPERFITQLRVSNARVREAMWYSLQDVPEGTALTICEKVFGLEQTNHREISEASWLVRRAAGSLVSCLSDSRRKKALLLALLSSPYWQDQCVGLIGARYLLANEQELFLTVQEKVKKGLINRIDAVWLANLYSCENPDYDVKIYLITNLSKTQWGLCELLKAYTKSKYSDKDDRIVNLDQFFSLLDDKQLAHVQGYISYTQSDQKGLRKELVNARSRGRLPEKAKHKFILSLLYGSWRDQKHIDLSPFLENAKNRTIESQLEDASKIPCCESKMGLLTYFTDTYSKNKKYVFHLQWALNDPNLWVRREAVKLHSLRMSPKKLEPLVQNDDFDNFYPGIMDLFLALPLSVFQHATQQWWDSFTPDEYASLKHAYALG